MQKETQEKPVNLKTTTKSDNKTSLSVYLRLLKSARPYWGTLVLGFIGTFLASGADSGLSYAVKPLVDHGLVARNHTFLVWLPLVIIIAFIIRGVTLFASNYCIMRVGRTIVMNFRQRIFAQLMRLPTSYYEEETSGHLLSLIIYNTEQLATAATDALLTVLQEGMLFIGLVVVMFVINWKLALLFLVSAPIITWIVRYTTKRLRMLSTRVQNCVGDVTHVAEEAIEGFKVVRIFGGEKYEQEKFDDATRRNRHQEMKVVMTDSLGSSFIQIIASLPIALIVYVAVVLKVTIGSFSAMVVAVIRLMTPMRRLTKINTAIQKGVAAAQSIFDLLDEAGEEDSGAKTVTKCNGTIEYQNVTFKYPRGKKNVLSRVNFQIETGKTVALVGRSGGGKSTLVGLLPRFYDVLDGKILLDGHDIRDYKLRDLRNQFAFVSQHVTLFNDTIERNICYGMNEVVSENKLWEIAKAAHLADYIKTLPNGFKTVIGEHGLLLSGGQRQRLAIARALMKHAPILILDEATSSLDTESEHHIQAALDNLMHRQTTLVIAHRLSTIEKADMIMVMDEGKIVERGTHKELLAKNGIYAMLYKMQFKEGGIIQHFPT